MKEIRETSQEQRELRKRVLSLLILKESYKRKEAEYKQEASEVNHLVETFLKKRGDVQGLIQTDKEKIALTVVEPTTVIWDADKLSEKLDSDLAEDIIHKQAYITDYKAVVELLKRYQVPAKEFKQFIDVRKEVNEEAIEKLSELGWLNKKDVEGCYTMKKNKSYVRLTRSEKEE